MASGEPQKKDIQKELEEKFPQKEMSLRLISAGVLLPFGVFVVFFGKMLYAATLLVLCCVLAWEYVRLWCYPRFAREFMIYASVLLAVVAGFYTDLNAAQWVFAGVAAVLLGAFTRKLWLVGGVLIAALFFHFGLEFRLSETHGMAACVLLCATAWGGDTGAFVMGRLFGGPKLAPQISPKKTWSGFWGALAGGAFFTSLMALFLSVPITLTLLIWAMGCSLIGVAGDLFESWMKRLARVKDTSDLIPGHGGLLDRFDGLIAVVLVNGGWIMLSSGSGSFADILLNFLRGQ